jgi:hypothetical protein
VNWHSPEAGLRQLEISMQRVRRGALSGRWIERSGEKFSLPNTARIIKAVLGSIVIKYFSGKIQEYRSKREKAEIY